MSRASSLYRLQQLDTEEEQVRRRLAEIAAALGENAALRQAQEMARKTTEQAQRWTIRQRDLELEIQGLRAECEALERKLYEGSIRNPKELGELAAKVDSLKRLLARKEEDLLEAMIGREEAEAARDEAQARLQEVQAAWKADQAALQAEKDGLENRLAQVAQGRQALVPSIPTQDLDAYHTLRRTKGGLAVAIMRAQACVACGMEVPPGYLQRGREMGLLFCGNCERILVPEEEVVP